MKKYFIYDTILKFIDNPRSIKVLGDGEQIRDYLYIDDVIDAIVLVAENGRKGEDYNLGSGQPNKIINVINKIASLMNINAYEVLLTKKSWPGDIKVWYADITKINKLGFKQKINFDTGLKKTIDAVSENYKR